ncbi:MAG: spore coat protein CotJB [Ruminococcus sp.]|nr:spore coat protein CotJB [Ruminococcus sp.]
MTEREILTKKLSSYQFAVADMRLYLDTHPNDSETIKKMNEYTEKMNALKKTYEEKYGPLTKGGTTGSKWKWINSPWPWESEEVD